MNCTSNLAHAWLRLNGAFKAKHIKQLAIWSLKMQLSVCFCVKSWHRAFSYLVRLPDSGCTPPGWSTQTQTQPLLILSAASQTSSPRHQHWRALKNREREGYEAGSRKGGLWENIDEFTLENPPLVSLSLSVLRDMYSCSLLYIYASLFVNKHSRENLRGK